MTVAHSFLSGSHRDLYAHSEAKVSQIPKKAMGTEKIYKPTMVADHQLGCVNQCNMGFIPFSQRLLANLARSYYAYCVPSKQP